MDSDPSNPFDPFSEPAVGSILRVNDSKPDRLRSRENTYLEFKESFNWAGRAKYARTCAAFANTRGGYLVFGVADRTRRVIGLQTDAFDNRDPATITEYFNQHFSPEIHWEAHSLDWRGFHIGFIYISAGFEKPVICTCNDSDIHEAAIYYRYRARTEAIRYPELRAIIDETRKRDHATWLSHIRRMARIGVRETAVLDLTSGTGTGSGGAFVIDKSLLERIKFIREGQFHERTGAPTIRIIGEAQPIPDVAVLPTRTVFRTRVLNTPEIMLAFLEHTNVSNPQDYIMQACFATHPYLPIYYFIRLAGMTSDSALDLIRQAKSTSSAKDGLIRRLQSGDHLRIESEQTRERLAGFRSQLVGKNLNEDIPEADLISAVQAIRTLHNRQVDSDYLCPLLKRWFDKNYADTKLRLLAHELRQAICFVDRAINRSAIYTP
jgi:hypothetical protein